MYIGLFYPPCVLSQEIRYAICSYILFINNDWR